MKKPKMSLTEELRKIDHMNGYSKDFTLEESKRYTQQIKNRTYDLKILTEEKDIKISKHKDIVKVELLGKEETNVTKESNV